ncbi:MAG: polyhydroxyalkanoate synthesis regulator DNA-binding domain-containing protein [Phycisphaerae bacterium]
MSDNRQARVLSIKKYGNRRFYDSTRSCHVTLKDMYELVGDGYELQVTDGKTGNDITNLVLTQILLERDAPKLDIFPASMLHQVIRTQREFLGSVVEQFFAQVLETHKTSQEQWIKFIRNTLGVDLTQPLNPMDWRRGLMEAMTPSVPSSENSSDQRETQTPTEVEALRRQVEELTRQVQRMAERKAGAQPK